MKTWMSPWMSVSAVALVLAAAVGVSTGREEEEAQPAPGVRAISENSTTRLTATLPGRLLGVALPRVAGGRREVVALVEPLPAASEEKTELEAVPCEGRPAPADPRPARQLVLIDQREQLLEVLRDDLPAWAEGVQVADLDGDGADELLLVGKGTIQSMRQEGGRLAARGPDLLLSDPVIDVETAGMPDAAASLGLRLFPVHTLGAVRFYGAPEAGQPWGLALEEPLPVSAWKGTQTLRLRSPMLRRVGVAAGGGPLLAAGPEHHGKERLQSILIDPSAPSGRRRLEAWSRLPEPERVIDSAFGMLDGRPALIVTTTSAVKLKILAEKRLRLYLLDEVDRSRSGVPPVLAAESEANLWQTAVPALLDADADGRQDLVLGYWKGLKDHTLVLDAYLRQSDGSFATSPRTTRFDVEGASRSVLGYGRDLDGDGRADLMLHASGRLMIFAGSASSSGGRGLVETAPRWSVAVGQPQSWDEDDFDLRFTGEGVEFQTASRPWGAVLAVDLDGDGRAEIIAPEQYVRPGVIHLIRLQP